MLDGEPCHPGEKELQRLRFQKPTVSYPAPQSTPAPSIRSPLVDEDAATPLDGAAELTSLESGFLAPSSALASDHLCSVVNLGVCVIVAWHSHLLKSSCNTD